MLIVSDTSPLSALAKMGWLAWLELRWKKVVVPEAVWAELQRMKDEAARERLNVCVAEGWLEVHAVRVGDEVRRLSSFLDPGESEAIALALELRADAIMIDEADGRNAAKEAGLHVTGTMGLIVWAKRQGLVASAKTAMEQLVTQTRFFVSDAVRAEVLQKAGELGGMSGQ